jgi:hypothetical protein
VSSAARKIISSAARRISSAARQIKAVQHFSQRKKIVVHPTTEVLKYHFWTRGHTRERLFA